VHAAEPRRGPKFLWFLITIIAGVAGAAGSIAIAGHGTYDVGPFKTELRAWPATAGKTELAVKAPLPGVGVGSLLDYHAEAGTHRGPIDFKATVVGISSAVELRTVVETALNDPRALATEIKNDGQHAIKSFAIKLGALALGGGLGAGLIISLGRWRRILGGAVAGLLAFAIVGFIVQSTYDANEFSKTRFVSSQPAPSTSTTPS
jgi:hypothetical protein